MVRRSAVVVPVAERIARSLVREKDLLNPPLRLVPQLLLLLESLRLATLVQRLLHHRRNQLSKSKAKVRATVTRRSVVVVDVVVHGQAMAQYVTPQRWMLRSSSVVKVASAMVDQLVATSCACKFVMESPRLQSWKAAA
jgi:hypothetical protein